MSTLTAKDWTRFIEAIVTRTERDGAQPGTHHEDTLVSAPMMLGPERRTWTREPIHGSCPHCGWQCAPVCGRHPLGCEFGGPSEASAYWLIAIGCELDHGNSSAMEHIEGPATASDPTDAG